MKWLLLAIVLAFALWATASPATARHSLPGSCALFPIPDTYEGPQDRNGYLLGEDLAAYNMIAANDPFFGTPIVELGPRSDRHIANEPYIPPTLLKATGTIESNLAQADHSVNWGSVGPAKVSFDCGHGIMQITSGMTSPADNGWPSRQQSLVAAHYLFNIARGAAILVGKWNAAPEARPIVGDGDPRIVENWYYAVWSYNGFTGPGAFISNHPMDPIYEWPRTGFSCGPLADGYGHSYRDYPYQELVFGCAARPRFVDIDGEFTALWDPLDLNLPDLNDPAWSGPLSLSNFVSPYREMDIPTPGCSPEGPTPTPTPTPTPGDPPPTPTPTPEEPTPLPPCAHEDPTLQPNWIVPALLLGSPELTVSHTQVSETVNLVTISNTGDSVFGSILVWRVTHDPLWIGVDKQAGIALEPGVPCTPGFPPCERSATLRITVDPELAPPSGVGTVLIESLTTGEIWEIRVLLPGTPDPGTKGDVDCNDSVDGVDSLLVLRLAAGLGVVADCTNVADVNCDEIVNAIDALLILRHIAGLPVDLPANCSPIGSPPT